MLRRSCMQISTSPADAASVKVACLVCRIYFSEADSLEHKHDNILTTFGKKGEIVVLCCRCRTLHKDLTAYWIHHEVIHPNHCMRFAFRKLNNLIIKSVLVYACGSCPQLFPNFKDMTIHVAFNHGTGLNYSLVPKYPDMETIDLDEVDITRVDPPKRKSNDCKILRSCKKTARKSTTELPISTT